MLFISDSMLHPPSAVAIHHSMTSLMQASESSHWLLAYKGRSAREVVRNSRFRQLLEGSLPHYTVPWYSSYGKNHTLPEGIPQALEGFADPVSVESDRFVSISGAFGTEADFKGLLWVNTGFEAHTSLFAFMMQSGSAASLDIYTNDLSPSTPLPPQFISSLLHWKKRTGIATISGITIHDAQNKTMQAPPSIIGGT